jgi:hypothetical protein
MIFCDSSLKLSIKQCINQFMMFFFFDRLIWKEMIEKIKKKVILINGVVLSKEKKNQY